MYHRKHCKVYTSDLAKTAVKLIFVLFLIRNCLFYEPFFLVFSLFRPNIASTIWFIMKRLSTSSPSALFKPRQQEIIFMIIKLGEGVFKRVKSAQNRSHVIDCTFIRTLFMVELKKNA